MFRDSTLEFWQSSDTSDKEIIKISVAYRWTCSFECKEREFEDIVATSIEFMETALDVSCL